MALDDAVPSSAADVFKRNADDIDRLVNSTGNVTTRTDKVIPTWDEIVKSHAAWNNRGDWITATAYAISDIWKSGSNWYVVLTAYTSGATAESDISSGNVIALAGDYVEGVAGTADGEVQTNGENRAEFAAAFVAGQAGTADAEIQTNGQNRIEFNTSDSLTLDHTSVSGASGGSAKLTREGNIVNFSGIFSHASSAAWGSGAGAIPVEYRPSADVNNVYYTINGDYLVRMLITATGIFVVSAWDFTGAPYPLTSTEHFSVTYSLL